MKKTHNIGYPIVGNQQQPSGTPLSPTSSAFFFATRLHIAVVTTEQVGSGAALSTARRNRRRRPRAAAAVNVA